METRDAPHLLPGVENSNSWRASVHGFLSVHRDASMFSTQPQIRKVREGIINHLKPVIKNIL